MTDDELLSAFISQQKVTSNNTQQLFAVGLIGLPGSGKSTVVAELADRLGLYVASNDVIRRFLNAQGFEGDAPVQQTLQFIAESFGIYLYEHKVSHIIDADLLKFYEAARNKAYSHGAKFYLIDIECADAVIRQRILDRGQEITAGTSDNLSRADIAEYERRKAIHQEVSRPSCDFTVHTDQPLEPQLQSIITRLQGDGVA